MMDREDVLCSSAWLGDMCRQAEICGRKEMQSKKHRERWHRKMREKRSREKDIEEDERIGQTHSGEEHWCLWQLVTVTVSKRWWRRCRVSPAEDNFSDGMCAWVPAVHLTALGCMLVKVGHTAVRKYNFLLEWDDTVYIILYIRRELLQEKCPKHDVIYIKSFKLTYKHTV